MTATAPTASTNRPRPTKRRSGRRWPWIVVGVAVLAGGGWGALAYVGRTAGPVTVNALELVTVSRGRVEKAVTSSGKVVSNLDVDIKCRASGEVIKLPFDISQSVHKGDLLCQLDPTDSQLTVRSAEATLAQSTAKLAQAKHDLQQSEENLVTTRRRVEATVTSAKVKAVNLRSKAERQKQLIEKQLGSREEGETAETEAAAAEMELAAAQIAVDELKQQEIQIAYKGDAVKMVEGQLQADTINLEVQKQQLGYATVVAPIDGVVAALNVQKGTIVASGMSGFSGGTTIMTLSDLSHVFITATVDESDIGEVRMGQAARITVASFPGRTFAGQVMRIATKGVNVSNVVTFEVKVEVLDEHKDMLRPEMTGNVTIIQAEKANVLMVPSSALMRQGEQTVVRLADGQKRSVGVGLQGTDTVEIVMGLSEGEKVRSLTAELPTRWKSQDNGPPGP